MNFRSLMSEFLTPGMRRLPGHAEIDVAFGTWKKLEGSREGGKEG